MRSPGSFAAALAVVLIAAACAPVPPGPQGPPPTTVPPGSKVYLTFDDGPSIYTPQVLSVLQAKGVPATFFVVGKNAAQHPSTVQQEHAAGEGTGNHTWDHQDLTTLSADQVRTELQSTSDEIANLIGTPPVLWRPPYGAVNDNVTQIASSLGLSMRLWDVDSSDWTVPGVDSIVSNVVGTVKPDAIILFHDGSPGDDEDRSQTVTALPTVIDRLRSMGYSFGSLVSGAGASSAPTGPTGPSVPIGPE